MFLVNNKKLLAETEQSVVEIQLKVVNLYAQNISGFATQACLLAALAYVGISNPYTVDGPSDGHM